MKLNPGKCVFGVASGKFLGFMVSQRGIEANLEKVQAIMMQRGRVEAESVTHNYYNSSTKPKFYKNTRLVGKIIEKTSLTNFY